MSAPRGGPPRPAKCQPDFSNEASRWGTNRCGDAHQMAAVVAASSAPRGSPGAVYRGWVGRPSRRNRFADKLMS